MSRDLIGLCPLALGIAGLLAINAFAQTRPQRAPVPQQQSAVQDDRDHRSAPSRVGVRPRMAPAQLIVPMSTGYYRIPYADGTTVRIGSDHNSHSPVGRYDMSGTGGRVYRIVAAAQGRIEAIEDGFSAMQDSDTAPQCNNNYVWIRHPNGEVSKYSHMTKGSTTGKAGLKVGDQVKAGQYLGDEGAVGCATGNHLHFEIGRPRRADWYNPIGGFLRDNAGSNRNRIARICGIPGGMFVDGETYTASSQPDMLDPGSAEIARHGLPIADYQCFFDQARLANYEPEWIDMFNVGANVFVNTIWRPESGGGIAAFHGLTGAQFQARFDEWTGKGYRPTILESYLHGGGPRYAVVFKQAAGPAYSAYHGLDANAHQQKFDTLTAQGFRPVAVSVVSSGGHRYTALFHKADVGGYQLKSQLPLADYQQAFNENVAAGRRVAYLNGYNHNGQPFISAIFTSQIPAGGKQRHGLSGAAYQNEYDSARQAGMLTRIVTGYADGNQARYAASWR
ncbi:MAG TPA: peptidoglycan DD-metalloendopeptidase family protein [Sphingomicrobium sp.]|nr:peptidoglycan DD-metalloendopeptidase family protein [Sphingomicrobium sp.]